MQSHSESGASAAEPSSNLTSSEPKDSESLFSHPRPPANRRFATRSEATAASSVSYTTTQLIMQAVALLPPAPANTPATQSAASVEEERPNFDQQIESLAHRLARFESRASTASTENEEKEDEHFHEHSTWSEDVCQECEDGLKRLANLATDLNKIDGSVSAEEYYSKTLGEAIRAVGVKVDLEILRRAMDGDE